MRESFGGAFMIKLAIVFLIIYISFMAISINYAKAFRVKNRVINILEQYQFSGDANDEALEKMDEYLKSVSYKIPDYATYSDGINNNCENSGDNHIYRNGVCIAGKGDNDSRYYVVTTYFSLDFLFFNINLVLPIKGETKTIVY